MFPDLIERRPRGHVLELRRQVARLIALATGDDGFGAHVRTDTGTHARYDNGAGWELILVICCKLHEQLDNPGLLHIN